MQTGIEGAGLRSLPHIPGEHLVSELFPCKSLFGLLLYLRVAVRPIRYISLNYGPLAKLQNLKPEYYLPFMQIKSGIIRIISKLFLVNLPCVRRTSLPSDQLIWLFILMATLHSTCEYCIASGPSQGHRQILC